MPATSQQLDPLTILHNAVEKCLQDSPAMKNAVGLVLNKNIIAFNKTRGTEEQDTNSETDVPSLKLMFTGGVSDIALASNMCNWNPVYTLILNTGSQVITDKLLPILFAIYSTLTFALYDQNSKITGCQWNGQPFCQNFRLSSTTAGQSNPLLNKSIKGWTGLCTITFNLNFQRRHIDAWAQQTPIT